MLRTQSATMLHLLWLVGSLLVLTVESRVGDSSQSLICYETEQCLLFDQICETNQYEVRHYDAVKWVTTEEKAFIMNIAVVRASERLSEYFRVNRIKMVAPAILKIQDRKTFWDMGVYSLSFLLPAEHQENPPKPTDKVVHITETPRMTVYVESYGGWITSLSDQHHAKTLSSALELVNAKYNKHYHYAAGYNSPTTLFNRHNEVWFVAEGEPECPSSEELESSSST